MRAVLFAAVCAASVLVGAPPDYSGAWKINLAKSDFAQMGPPDGWTRTIKQAGSVLELESAQEREGNVARWSVKFEIGGPDAKFQMGGGDALGSLKWDGNVLVMTTRRDTPQGEIKQNERWELSADGKTMTVHGKLSGSFGEMELKLVWEKS